ncbi:hypothetical protein JCM8097_007469 [Rhodosporidiobolus ruineniae]
MVASLEELQGLKYAQLRTLCKENNLKAAGKTDALIASLAEHFGFTAAAEEEPAAAPPVKKAPVKKTVAAKGKGRKALELEEEVVEEQHQMVQATPVKVQEKIVYQTSPNTKASVNSLLSTVKSLQSQLTAANSAISTLQSKPAPAPSSPALKKADILVLIESKVAESRKALTKEFEDRFKAVSTHLSQLDDDVEEAEQSQQKSLEQLRSTFTQELESAIAGVRDDLVSRFAAQPELEVTVEVEEAPATPVEIVAAVVAAPPLRRRVSFAESPEIADLDCDAPPTRSVSFSSPRSPAIHTPTSSSTPRRSSLAQRKATPFKVADASAAGATPASALPSHMLATAASAAKRSSRAGRVSAPAAVQQPAEPMSPAGPPLKAALGKRTRHSDASELSIDVAALDSPAAEARSRTATASSASSSSSSKNSVVSPGRRLSEILASVKEDQHVRKRLRVSTGSIIDHGAEAEQQDEDEDEEDDEDFHDSFDGSEDQSTSFDESLVSEEDGEEEVSVRDYLVAVKTGDEEPTALKPAPRSPAPPAKSAVNDSSFFAGIPSPAANSRRSTLNVPISPAPVAAVKENAAPASARESLPMAALPCPIVSPYTKKASTSTSSATATPGKTAPSPAAPASTAAFTPSSILNRRITIGPAASARKATPSARANPYSAKKPTPARAVSGPAGTPQAARTLFGSERAVPSSASIATSKARTAYGGCSAEGESSEEGESRFGDDGFVSAGTSPVKSRLSLGGWGLMGGFGSRE